MEIQKPTTQAMYTKSVSDGSKFSGIGSSSTPPQPTAKKPEMKKRQTLGIIALLFFIVVAGFGVAISLRQTASVPVAPNVPESEPSAFYEKFQCTTTFEVEPPSGTAKCEYKEAHTSFLSENADSDQTRIVAGSTIARGAQFIYRIGISTTELTTGDVKVVDELPEGVEFVADPLNTEGITYDAETRTVSVNVGQTSDPMQTVEFLVEVAEDTEVDKINNKALITTSDQNPSACSVQHFLPPTGIAQCIYKQGQNAFIADDVQGDTLLPEGGTVNRGDQFVYKIQVGATETTAGEVTVIDELPEELKFVDHPFNSPSITYDAATRSVMADLGTFDCDPVEDGTDDGDSDTYCKTVTLEFLVEVIGTAPAGSFTNTATIWTNEVDKTTCEVSHTVVVNASPTPSPSPSPSPSATPVASPTPSPSPTYSCSGACQTDSQCQTVNANWICSADHGNTCRLDSNRDATNCQPASQTYACNSSCSSDSQCQTANSNFVCSSGTCRLSSNPGATNCQPVSYTPPPPAVGCNDRCSSNSDCANADHICYTTSDGAGRCRLAEYVNSDTCTTPQESVIAMTDQPALPEVLPQSGPSEWVDWLKAGLVTLGIGAALLLLL